MGSVAELKDAVKDALQRKGLLSQLQANVRSQIFNVLLAAEETARPEPCDETLVINELIREYLVWHGLRDTLSVFIPESGQPPSRPFDREFLAQKLQVHDTPQAQHMPLLYHLVAQQQQQAPQASTRSQEPQQPTAASRLSSQAHQPHRSQQQQAALAPSRRAALHPAGQQREQQQLLAVKGADSELSELHSLSSMSEATTHGA